jgi:hypothetical protein
MKISRNDPCPCGSGKKYKRCHLAKDEALALEQGPRIVERAGEKFMVSDGVRDDDLEAAAEYFERRDQRAGPAQQMVEFVQPLLDKTDGSEEQMNKVFALGMLCWNIAILPEAKREDAILAAAGNAANTEEGGEAFRDMVEFMVERHEELFPELHQRHASRAG